MNMSNCKCETTQAPSLIFACSGAADVGELADQAARKMTKEHMGKMFCLSGVGGRVAGIMTTTKAAQTILAIDGCTLDCTKRCLEEAGFEDFLHLQLADLGLLKGETELNTKNLNWVIGKAEKLLHQTRT